MIQFMTNWDGIKMTERTDNSVRHRSDCLSGFIRFKFSDRWRLGIVLFVLSNSMFYSSALGETGRDSWLNGGHIAGTGCLYTVSYNTVDIGCDIYIVLCYYIYIYISPHTHANFDVNIRCPSNKSLCQWVRPHGTLFQ
jgi:hypothetical protein